MTAEEFRANSLIEVPMPTWRVLRQNIPFSGGGLSAANNVRSQGGQASMPVKLERILRQGEFETLGQYVGRLRVGGELAVG